MCHKNNILKGRRGPHALAVRILTKVGVFPTFHIYVRPWQQCLLCLPHALPHIPNLKQNRDPGRLYKGRPSAVHAQKDSTFASLAKGGKRSERG